MSTTTNLREAVSAVTVTGVLSEKDLKEVITDGAKSIRGKLVLQVSSVNFVTFPVFVNQKKADGSDNKIYASMETVMRDYHSVSEVGSDDADVVSVTRGQLNPRSFVNDSGRHESVNFRSNFFNRVNKNDYTPVAEVEAEIYIGAITREVYRRGENQGEETGRVVIKGWMPLYNDGIEPVYFIVTEDIADQIESEYAVGQTVTVYATIDNRRVEEIIEKPVKIGKPKKEVKTYYVNELVLTGISEAYEEGITKFAPYETDAIQKAITEREIRLDNAATKPATPKASAQSVTGRRVSF